MWLPDEAVGMGPPLFSALADAMEAHTKLASRILGRIKKQSRRQPLGTTPDT